ncbi:hypothetical protein [Mesoplasma whartonense]|uniref:hypothetical protein n=1 Tax=Mesoplasma whartonense TaxID=2878854 RepID=UPI002022AD4A|nr:MULTISPECIES: hypothetical protein [unclassified Mesoplasma]MCL8212957.1 hypothetical protein [Mesoplasma sp. JKS002661]MCL8216156.1 hypothetical protein [Mesoplasma sp. JKS002657]
MDDHVFQIIMSLIAIISTITGGTGAVVGVKSNSKHKALNKKLTERVSVVEAEITNLKEADQKIEKLLLHMDKKIDKIKDILIQKKEVNNA